MSATTTKNEVKIIPTSTPNFFYAPSSDGVNVYGLIYTGPGSAICSCVGCEVYGKNCRHRKVLLANFLYIDPEISLRFAQLEADLHEINETLRNALEDQAEREDYEELFSIAA
jgi:hypothetical protein